MSAKKSRIVELIEEGIHTLVDIADQLGMDERTIYRWRHADPVFDAACATALEQADRVRVHKVEDSLYRRLDEGEASAAEMVFFLCNRAPHRWRHVQTIQHTGGEGGPIRHAVDLTRLNDEELRTFEQLARRAAVVSRN
jgi:transposase-like protein